MTKEICNADREEHCQVARRLLINYIEGAALESPDKPAIHQLLASNVEYPGEESEIIISYQALVNLVDKLAWWLSKEWRIESEPGSIIAYLGPSDLRHLLLFLAISKTGRKALFISPRNSIAMNEALIKETKTTFLLYDYSCRAVVTELSTEEPLQARLVDNLACLLGEDLEKVSPYPHDQTWTTSRSDTALVCNFALQDKSTLISEVSKILHTSGSTGMPKPVFFSHAALAAIDAHRLVSEIDSPGAKCQLELLAETRCAYNAFPLFHVAGFGLSCFLLFSGSTLMLGYPNQPPSMSILRKVLGTSLVDGVLLPPSLIEEMARDSEVVERLSELRLVFCGGGSIPKSAGNLVASKTRLLNGLGSTECGSLVQYPTDPSYWNLYHFHDLNGIRWRPLSVDSKHKSEEYEMVIKRDETSLSFQAVFHNYPSLQEWATKDVFQRHPLMEYYWEYLYRLDDIIVFASGEKMNPIPIERHIVSQPGITAALVFGDRRPYPGVLVELGDLPKIKDSVITLETSVKQILKQFLETLNTQASRDSQLSPDSIIIASPEKPFIRTGKGTVHRKKTLELYSDRLDALYDLLPLSLNVQFDEWQLDLSSLETVISNLIFLFDRFTSTGHSLHADEDIFTAGIDSKQAQIVAVLISNKLCDQHMDGEAKIRRVFSVDSLYQNPTPRTMARHIFHKVSPSKSEARDFDTVQSILQRYSELNRLDAPFSLKRQRTTPHHRHVVLTGSTGFVGTYILETLLYRKDIRKVTCLNRQRGSVSGNKTEHSNPVDFENFPLIEHIYTDLFEEKLGLSGDIYENLLHSVTDIIHCQWPVDFNLSVKSFEPSIKGVARLIEFTRDAKNDAHLVFLSSIATVQKWSSESKVPERSLESPYMAETGYGESKLIATLLLHHASQMYGVRTSICRVGQVSGPVTGCYRCSEVVWPRRDWFPTLLFSARQLGFLPNSLGSADIIDWMPVDTVAQVLTDIIFCPEAEAGNTYPLRVKYYHIVNPRHQSYSELVPFLRDHLGGPSRHIEAVPLEHWVELLSKKGLQIFRQGQQLATGIELLGFYQNLADPTRKRQVILDTSFTEEQLPRLKSVEPVTESWMSIWLEQWGLKD